MSDVRVGIVVGSKSDLEVMQRCGEVLDGYGIGWEIGVMSAHRAGEVVRISAGHDSAWRMMGEQDAAYNALGYSLRLPLALNQVRWELAASRQRLLDALSAVTPRGLDGSLYGEAGLRSAHEAAHAGWIKRWRGEQGI